MYITRDESHPLIAGEPKGLKYAATPTPPHYEGVTGNCEVIVPACLTHLHQRTWVAVLGVGTTSPGATPTPTTAAEVGGTPTTAVGPASGTMIGALLAAVLALLLVVRPRRRRPLLP